MTSTWQTFRESKWRSLLWLAPVAVVVLVVAVLAARAFVGSDTGRSFLESYPGASELPEGAPRDAPWWLQWQHALNFFLIVLIIRSGWMVHSQLKPEAYWTRNNKGPFKTKNPPEKMSIYLWLHQSLDVVWVLNGVFFAVLLFTTGGWKRVVPVSWDVFPNALSAGIQYLSLDWPVESPWVNYNALQLLAYFVTIFIAAPLAIVSGLRMSSIWGKDWKINKAYPVELARAVHLPVMFYFVVFIISHVALVFATGMRRNLNYMFSSAGENSTSWWGFIIFLITLLIVVAGWVAARPLFLQPVASLTGRVTSR